MNIYFAATIFALLILIYWLISELFTVLFRFVGLPGEKARFQVTSLLTGCGFTTRESEMILSSKSRRRLARITMLFGYVFNITVVSAFVNVLLSLKASQLGGYVLGIVIPLSAVLLVFVIFRLPPVHARIESWINRLAGNIMKREASNTIMLIDYIGKGTIAQVRLKELPEYLEGVQLAKSGLKEKRGILVMLVEHEDATIEAPSASTVFVSGDKLTVFGDYKTICKTFHAKEMFA